MGGEGSGGLQDEVLTAVLERVQPLVSDTVDAAPEIGLVDAPDTFLIGTTVLSVEATDQSGNSATAQTSIIVVRSVQQPFFVSAGADFEVNAFYVLTFDIAVENPDALDYKITSADMPSGAKLEGLTFKWLPKNADAGQLSISFALEVAGETVGEAFVATVTVNQINRSPKVDDIANGKVDLADQPTVEIAVSAFDPDPDSALEFTVVRIGSRGPLPVVKDEVASEEDEGTRVNVVLEWTPDAVTDLDQIVKLVVSVTDGELTGKTQFSYGVGAVNNPPKLKIAQTKFNIYESADDDESTEQNTVTIALEAEDLDEDELTFEVIGVDADRTSGQVVLDLEAKTFTWQPGLTDGDGEGGARVWTIQIKVVEVREDEIKPESDKATVLVRVENKNTLPSLELIADTDVEEGELLSVVIAASDDDGEELEFIAENLPVSLGAALIVEDGSARIEWTPPYDIADVTSED